MSNSFVMSYFKVELIQEPEEPESSGIIKEVTGGDELPPITPEFARHVQRLVDDPVYAEMYEEYVKERANKK